MKINQSSSTAATQGATPSGKGQEGVKKPGGKQAFAELIGDRKTLDERKALRESRESLEQVSAPGDEDAEDALTELEDRVEKREAMREEQESLRAEHRQLERQADWLGHQEKFVETRSEMHKEEALVGDKTESIDADIGGLGLDLRPDLQLKEVAKSAESAPTQHIAREIVETLHVGHDAQARKIMLVDVQIPGKGNVRIRLRRQGDNIEVRMRTQDQDLARTLRAGRDELREAGQKKGVNFTSIEVVS